MSTVKTAISMRESLFERVDALAQDLNMPRSHVFVLALEEFLERYENRKLLEAINEVHDDLRAQEEEIYRDQMRQRHRKMVEGQW